MGRQFTVGDRLLVRDRPWRVSASSPAGDTHRVLGLEALDGDRPATMSVVVPPEEPLPLPSADLEFDLTGLESFAAWSRAHRILAATLVRETGMLTGARFGRVALEAYQLAPALRLLVMPRPRLLVADDVGLGKTIEAGLAMLELMARGRAGRVLIAAPPGLLDQWSEELEEKFGLSFTVLENASGVSRVQTTLPAGVNPWDVLPRVLTSIDFLKKETIWNRALRKRWDLVVVDEAHSLAESGTAANPYRTKRTRLRQALREHARGILLLTATPHNGHAHSFRSLLEIVEPSLATLSGDRAHVERRIDTARIRRMKTQIRRRLPDGREEDVFPQRDVRGLRVEVESEAEKRLLREVASYCSKTARAARGTDDAELIGFAMQIVKKRALSSRAALATTLDHRLEALKKEEAREEPPDRSELRDLQADLPLGEALAERTVRRILRSAIPREEQRRRAEVKALTGISKVLKGLTGTDPKIDALLSELRGVFANPDEKAIVFTEYGNTLDAIRARIDADADLAGSYVVLRGGMSRRQRLRCQDAFDEPATRLLLATDAASEGLNLQKHCRRVIHFELPWNPNRMEQRNGRVDRYGQTRPPVIRYLYYPHSPEEEVLDLLVQKIENMAGDRVSTPDVLGMLAGDRDVEAGLVELDPEAADVRQRTADLVRLFEDRTADFVRNVQPLLAAGTGQDLAAERDRILRLLDTSEPLVPDDLDLESIAIDLLGPGNATADRDRDGVFAVTVPTSLRGESVPATYPAITFRRSVAVKHRADEVEHATPIHPLVRAMAADARRRLLHVYPMARGLPPRRLAVRTVAPAQAPGILFTFVGAIEGGGALLEEFILTVRVTLGGTVLDPGPSDLALLSEGDPPGNVTTADVARIFETRFETLRAAAVAAAGSRVRARADAVARVRSHQADILLRDLEADTADRISEVEQEERRAKGLITDRGEQLLFAEHDTGRGFSARRAAVEVQATARREEIAEFREVRSPGGPRPLGALFLVARGGEP
ncbi:MAG: DEAD/DEAH box helicase [Deltaproteobacteria bacterium]|nr:DEAD/DEAH box helicase [Deltaproteobacteria bacterium]